MRNRGGKQEPFSYESPVAGMVVSESLDERDEGRT